MAASRNDNLVERALAGLLADGRRARIAGKLPAEERSKLLGRYGYGAPSAPPATQAPATGAPASPTTGAPAGGDR